MTFFSGWDQLWADNFSPWHKEDVNPNLAANLATTVKASGHTEPEHVRFFVPLCGKSVDMKFLYDAGFQVIGVEGVEKACKEFMEENKFDYQKTEPHPGFTSFEVSS